MNIIHFHNGSGGGVLSVIRNLLAYRQDPNLQHHVVYTINQEQTKDYLPPGLAGAASEQVFYYKPHWNFYYTCRQLAKLLPADAVLVAHDWLELAMMSNLGLQYPVVQFLHGDYAYYYQLAVKHADWVDRFICVSASIETELKKRLPQRNSHIAYLRFPVPGINAARQSSAQPALVFAGRCEEAKGYFLLPKIDAALRQQQVYVQWHIAGAGSEKTGLQQIWGPADVRFYGNLHQEELAQLLLSATCFILPSIAEGMPVSVIEAMKAGAIPVVNDLPGGMQELVTDDETGYRIPQNDPILFAQQIGAIMHDSGKRKRLSAAAMAYANAYFDPIRNTQLIEQIFWSAGKQVLLKTARKTTGSRLDQPWLPNFLVKGIRYFNKQ